MAHQHTPSEPHQSSAAPGAFITNTAPSPQAFQEAVAKGYEPHDIGLRGVIVFIIGLSAVLVVVLMFVYAVMMALAEHDRSTDAIASPVKFKLPAIYAPLQPSLGFYGNHEQDHDVVDWQDMLVMREQVETVLHEGGTTAAGRHYEPIAAAIDTLVGQPLLASQPVLPAVVEPAYPPGSREGVYGSLPKSDLPDDVHVNYMADLNNLGN